MIHKNTNGNKRNTHKKRRGILIPRANWLSIFLVAVLIATSFGLNPAFASESGAESPASAIAPGASGGATIDMSDTTTREGDGWSLTNNVFTIEDGADVTITGSNVKTGPPRLRVQVAQSAKNVRVTLDGATIDTLVQGATGSAFSLNRGAEATLSLVGTNTLKGSSYYAGIQSADATLTIEGTGSLTAIGNGTHAAGIGGVNGQTGGTITINDGSITAIGARYGAGIGGGYNGAGGNITINGGNITATGNSNGAGIGGGYNGAGGTIAINGGSVIAEGGTAAAGVGGGWNKAGGNITINGGSVTAIGGSEASDIGRGANNTSSSNIIINGGSVNAEDISTQPKNSKGENVYLCTLTVWKKLFAVENTEIDGGSVNDMTCESIPDAAYGVYGIKDVATDGEGKVYFRLPESAEGTVALMADDDVYAEFVAPESSNTEEETLTTDYRFAPIIGGELGTAIVKTEYREQLEAETYENATIRDWKITDGDLPAELGIEDGEISGTPSAATIAAFTVTASTQYDLGKKRMSLLVRDATPDARIDYRAGELAGLAGNAAYKINGRTETSNADGRISIIAAWFGENVPIIKTPFASVRECDSDAQMLNIPERPRVPIIYAEDESAAGENDGKLISTTSEMEYSTDQANWTDCSNGVTGNLPPGIYYVRVKATESSFASHAKHVLIESGEARTRVLAVTAPAFENVTYGYERPSAKAIRISNIGSADTTISSVTLSSDAGDPAFEISDGEDMVSAGAINETWTIQPLANLDAGEYTATITVTYERDDGAATAIGSVSFIVEKADPIYTTPTGLTAKVGQTLADVSLPDGFTWEDSEATSVGDPGTNPFLVTFSPEDPVNYHTITGIEVEIEVVADPPKKIIYEVLEHFGTWTGNGTVSAKIDAEHEKFQGLHHQGAEIDPSDYTVTEGSTVVTLHEDYLKEHPERVHAFTATFDDGRSEKIGLKIAPASGAPDKPGGGQDDPAGKQTGDAAGNAGNAKTGDDSLPWLWLAVLLLAATGCTVGAIMRRRCAIQTAHRKALK